MDLLVLILIATVLMAAAGTPLAIAYADEMKRAETAHRKAGYQPLALAVWLLRGVVLVAWFLYARNVGEWLFFAIPATGVVGAMVFKFLARASAKKVASDA